MHGSIKWVVLVSKLHQTNTLLVSWLTFETVFLFWIAVSFTPDVMARTPPKKFYFCLFGQENVYHRPLGLLTCFLGISETGLWAFFCRKNCLCSEYILNNECVRTNLNPKKSEVMDHHHRIIEGGEAGNMEDVLSWCVEDWGEPLFFMLYVRKILVCIHELIKVDVCGQFQHVCPSKWLKLQTLSNLQVCAWTHQSTS